MIQKLQRRFALSRQGAVDLIKGCLACVLQDISFMFPVGLLYQFVIDFMNGGVSGGRAAFYATGCLVSRLSSPLPIFSIMPLIWRLMWKAA